MSNTHPNSYTGDFVGFYGCSGKLIRLRWAGPDSSLRSGESTLRTVDTKHKRPPRVRKITCPRCGNEHKINISWRKELQKDNIKEDMTIE